MTEVTGFSPTDASNTAISGESLDGSVANMSRMDNTLQAIIGAIGRWSDKGTIASATTTDIGAQPETYLTVSGTTTITGLGTIREGTIRVLKFDGALTLTYNATSLILPSAASIVTVADDVAVMVSEGLGNWRCVSYQRASGDTVSGASGKGNAPQNLSFTATVAANALTIAIKGHDGANPSVSNPVYIPFRSVTATSGDVEVLTLTSAATLVVSSGSTLGTTSAVASTLTIVGFNNNGTFRLGIINSPTAALAEGIASSTAEGGAGGADSSGVFYTTVATTSRAYIVLGYITITEATAGTWATAPTVVQVGTASQTAMATLPFTKSYISAEQTITSGGALTLTHTLGVAPKMTDAFLICKTAEKGYAVGDTVSVGNVPFNYSTSNYGHVIWTNPSDTATINVRYGSDGYLLMVANTGTQSGALTNASWRLVVKAWA